MRSNEKMARCFLWLRHKVVYVKGYGYRCKYCGEPVSRLKRAEQK